MYLKFSGERAVAPAARGGQGRAMALPLA